MTQSPSTHCGHGIAILLATALVYANSLGNSFHYDDLHTIQENPHIRTLANIPELLSSPKSFSRDPNYAMFRPLFLVSIAANYAWSGFDTYSYHLVNISLHAAASLLLWRILLTLGLSPLTALFGGMVFSLHPIGTEPVNYISSRSESLAAVFVLAAFHLHQLRLANGRVAYGICSVLCYGLGLLSKSVAITLPALLVLLEWAQRRRISDSLRRMAPYGVVAALYLVVISGFVSRAVVGEPLRSMGIQAFTQTKAVVYYLKLLVFPVGLSVHHQFFEGAWGPAVFWSGLFALSLVMVVATLKQRVPRMAGAWMVVYLLPTLAVPLFILVNDHRLYVPLAGGIILLAAAVFPPRRALCRAYIAVLVVFAALVVQRNQVWHDEYTLWTDVERKSPEPFGQPVAYIHLGNYSKDHGELGKAVAYFRRALEMSPAHVAAKNNLANTYEQLGQHEEARRLYKEVLAANPELAEPRYNLGRLSYFQGRPDEAITHLRAVPEESYHHDLALNMLGVVYEKTGRLDSAVSFYRRALGANPGSADASDNVARLRRQFGELGRKLMESGELKQVEFVARRLLEASPKHRDALFHLSVSLFRQRRYRESVEVNRKLVESHPEFGEGYIQLGNVYETLGELEAAAPVYERGLRRVRDRDPRDLLAQRLASLRDRLGR